MNFKTKVAYSAVLATLGLAAGSAQAAYLSEEGTGQVLLYPYYSVQGGMDTYISVVNTTSRAKAVKVRFIEGRGSNEALDFNLYLSQYDVWNAAVTTTDAANPLAGAKIVTNDKSCTVPAIPAGGQAFRNGQYTSTAKFGQAQLGTGIDRTREGYVEIIEMGVPNNLANSNGTNSFEWSVTHNTTTHVPNDCAWVQNQFGGVSTASPVTKPVLALDPRTGGLIGTGTLINVNQGVDYSYDPVAIEDYNTVTTTNLHFAPGSLQPALSDAESISAVIDGVGTIGRRLLTTNWFFSGSGVTGLDAISAILMRNHVMNEYTVDPDLAAGTDWVVTFPTKRLYINENDQSATSLQTVRPFTKGAGPSTSSTWLACEPATFERYGREEEHKGGSIDFSPSTTVGTSLCYESNVITFANKNVLGSVNVKNNIDDVFSNGWIDLTFSAAGQSMNGTGFTIASNAAAVTAPASAVYYGLPVIGFAVQKYVNGTFNGAVGNYGGAYAHKYVRTVQ